MRLKRDNRGFSLFEMVVTIGIVAILAGFSLNMIGHMRSANVDKAAQTLSSAVSKQQINSMSKANKPYLYIYKYAGNYYYVVSNDASLNVSTVGTSGTPIGSGVTISYKNGVSGGITEIGTAGLKITFRKSGAIESFMHGSTVVSADRLILQGNKAMSKQLRFNLLTGKHVTEGADL